MDSHFDLSASSLGRPLEFIVDPLEKALLRGRLIDKDTGDRLPQYQAKVTQGAKHDVVVTDEQGDFVSTVEFDEGCIFVNCVDAPATYPNGSLTPLRIDFTPEQPYVELHVQVGPTYQLMISPPEAKELRAALLPSEWCLRANMDHLFVPVRQSARHAWVRFAPLTTYLTSATSFASWRIVLATADYTLAGEATIDCVAGKCPTPIFVDLVDMIELHLSVTNASNQPVSYARILLSSDQREYECVADEKGATSIRVQAGTYACVVNRAIPTNGGVIRAARPGPMEVPLRLDQPVGRVSGTINSATGTFRDDTEVILKEVTSGIEFVSSVQWRSQPDGRYVGVFGQDNIPFGLYRASPSVICNVPIQSGRFDRSMPYFEFMEEFLDWQPRDLEVSPPVTHVQFTCKDDDGRRDLGFHVECSVSGESPPWFRVYYKAIDGWKQRPGLCFNDRVVFHDVAESRPIEWALIAPGFRVVNGNEASFCSKLGDIYCSTLLLERGWSMGLRVTDSFGAPISGAKVEYGCGNEVVTDSGGWTIATDGAPAEEASITKPGYKPRLIRFASDDAENLIVRMSRAR